MFLKSHALGIVQNMQFTWVIINQVIISGVIIIGIEWIFASMNLMILEWYINVFDKITKTRDWKILDVSKQMEHKLYLVI